MTEVNYAELSTDLTTEGAMTRTLPESEDDGATARGHNAGARITVLFVLFFLGVIGNSLALLWIWKNRKRRSRVNNIVLGLATADFCVCIFTMLVSVIYELQNYHWYAGNVGCKIIMALQTASLMASSYMLVIMALDRHQAIRAPLKEGFSVKKMTILAWGLALGLSIPQMIVWQIKNKGFDSCLTNLKETPQWRLVYLIFGGLFMFFIPFVIITVAYIRLSKKIWDKARETSGKARNSSKKKKIYMQSTGSSSLNRAKIKTLKMSVVIIVLFVLCGLPYFVVEMIQSYLLHVESSLNPDVLGVFGIFAVSNSAVNPYVFLFFNKRTKCMKLIRLGSPSAPSKKKRRLGSRGASSSSYCPDETTKTMLETKAATRGDLNSYYPLDSRYNDRHNNDIRMDPIREDSKNALATRCDLNRNV
ncbi:cardioacceleratory peptide receptor-like [Acanthaster planci]|uniref:Cardioacceleratory peptide receptor-like n=1 Tax=Acanthaster planci TaxID=133434 RepID=A0A8B7ZVP5_ACAPL|nr:cardioacceleratory peptide receptor-like [Acanthaster planci]XP_022109624.1 cardioacceleratory peptide receptor-like [Acanthaster planci]